MTFAEFQATGRHVSDLGAIEHIAACGIDGPGRVYADDLFIQYAPTGWDVSVGSDVRAFGKLADAERALYEFALSEGYVS